MGTVRSGLGGAARGLAVMTLISLSACSSDSSPTAPEAGQTLKAHVLALLKTRGATDMKVIDPGGQNIACGDGKVKQTFGATGKDSAGSTDAEALNTMLVGALDRVAHYTVISADSPGRPIRAVNEITKTALIFESPGNGVYEVRGETDCLPAS